MSISNIHKSDRYTRDKGTVLKMITIRYREERVLE
jgi:hypothetical protein